MLHLRNDPIVNCVWFVLMVLVIFQFPVLSNLGLAVAQSVGFPGVLITELSIQIANVSSPVQVSGEKIVSDSLRTENGTS